MVDYEATYGIKRSGMGQASKFELYLTGNADDEETSSEKLGEDIS